MESTRSFGQLSRILIVDDEPDVVDLFRLELEQSGYEVGVAFNGVEAVLQVLDQVWNLMILDIQMPVLDGLNSFRIIQKISPNLPVVMLTGKAVRQEMLDSIGLGAYTCLLKPVPMEKLLDLVGQILDSKDPSALER